jgi:ABC-type Mn2+/Zn2+ transport system permease subunit
MGTVVSMLGMYFSVQFDLPTGATIVCTFGLALAAMAAVRPLFYRRAPKAASLPLKASARAHVG